MGAVGGSVRRMRRASAWIGFAVVASAVVGCSSETAAPVDSAPGTTTTTVAAATTTTTVGPATTAPQPGMSADEIAVRNALDLWALAFTKAANPRDPDHPLAAATMTGEMLDTFRRDFSEKKAKGLIGRRPDDQPMRHYTLTVRIEGFDKAVANECVIDDFVLYRETTNEVVDSSVTSMVTTATLRRGADGAWRIETRTIDRKDDGTALCESFA